MRRRKEGDSQTDPQTAPFSFFNQMLVDIVQGFVKTLGRNDVTAHLVMIAPRLVELLRV
jgi:hypothetical protein